MMMMKEKKQNKAIPVTAAGGVVYRNRDELREVLLIYRNERWDLPKGAQEEGESIRECAIREVSEETGIAHPFIEDALPRTLHLYQRNGETYRKTTHWFKMGVEGEVNLRPQVEEGIEQICWSSSPQARQKIAYDNLKGVISAFKATFS